MSSGNPLINPGIQVINGVQGFAAWKQGDAVHTLRAIYVELRTMNAILAAGLNQEVLLDQLRADVTAVMPDSGNGEYVDDSSGIVQGTS